MPGVGDALFDASSCVPCRLADHVQCAAQIEDTRHETDQTYDSNTQEGEEVEKVQQQTTLHSLVLSFFTLLPIYWKLDKTFGREKRSTKRFKNLTWRDTVTDDDDDDDVDLMLQSAVLCATIRALNWLQMHLWHSSLNYNWQLEHIRSEVGGTYRLNSAEMKLLWGLYSAGSLYMLHTMRSLQRSLLTPSCSMILSIFSKMGL